MQTTVVIRQRRIVTFNYPTLTYMVCSSPFHNSVELRQLPTKAGRALTCGSIDRAWQDNKSRRVPQGYVRAFLKGLKSEMRYSIQPHRCDHSRFRYVYPQSRSCPCPGISSVFHGRWCQRPARGGWRINFCSASPSKRHAFRRTRHPRPSIHLSYW
jgi:hypothetical protein